MFFLNAFTTFVYIFVGVKPWMSVPKPYTIKQQCRTNRFTTSKPWKPKKHLVFTHFLRKNDPPTGNFTVRHETWSITTGDDLPTPGSSGGTQLSGLRGISGIAGANWVSTVMGWGPGHESEGHGKIMGRWWIYGDQRDWMVIICDFMGFMLLWGTWWLNVILWWFMGISLSRMDVKRNNPRVSSNLACLKTPPFSSMIFAFSI